MLKNINGIFQEITQTVSQNLLKSDMKGYN